MEIRTAKKIGSTQGLKCVVIGLIIAQLIITLLGENVMGGFFWFLDFEYNLNVLIGICIMFLCGHFFGQQAGKEILIRGKNHTWVGFKYALATVLVTAFLSGFTGFFLEGITGAGEAGAAFNDYIFKPFFWVSIFGIVPAALVGAWFGRQIKKSDTVSV